MNAKKTVETEQFDAGELGAMMREMRENLGHELSAVAADLRIRLVYLEAIEAGRLKDLPGSAYVSGFLRAYSDYLGLDGEEIVRRFRMAGVEISNQTQLHLPSPVEEGRLPTGPILLLAAIVAGAAYGGWYYFSSPERDPVDKIASLPAELSRLVDGARENAGQVPAPTSPAAASDRADAPAAPASDGAAAPTQPAAQPAESVFEPETATAPPTGDSPVAATAPPAEPAETAAETAAAPAQPVAPETETAPGPPATAESGPAGAPATAAAVAPAVEPAPPASAPAPAARSVAAPSVAATDSAPPRPAPAQPAALPEAVVAEAPAAATETVTPPSSPAPVQQAALPPVASAPPAAREAAATRIVVRATADSFVAVLTSDKQPLFSQLMRPGDSYEVPSGAGLVLETGNAGGLEISVGGRKVPALGPMGEIRRDIPLDAARLLDGAN